MKKPSNEDNLSIFPASPNQRTMWSLSNAWSVKLTTQPIQEPS